VYQLGPRSWKPDTSLSQTVSDMDVERTCKLSHDILMSEIPASSDDADQLLKPADDEDKTSSNLLSQVIGAGDGQADLSSTDSVADDKSGEYYSKLTWSASSGIQHTMTNGDDLE